MSKTIGFSLMEECSKYEVPSKEENTALVRAAQQGDKEAKNTICLRNARLVLAIIRRYFPTHALDEDLFQQGIFGLMTAIERFDCELGTTFATYAFAWIRQSITRYYMDTGKTVRIPVHMHERITKVKREERVYLEQHGNLPSDEYLASLLNFDLEMVRNIHVWTEPMASLDSPVRNEEDQDSAIEKFVFDTRPSVEAEVVSSVFTEDLLSILSEKLTARECEIIKRRFGFGCEPVTLKELGREFGVSRERIRQIEVSALDKLKKIRGLRQLIA